MYIVSDKRMYRLSADRTGHPHIDREMSYRNSGIPKPSQVDASSGATPTIPPGGLVAITDNADPMDAVVYRTATRLRHHQHRVVCQVPVFAKSASASENSLIGSGRSPSVENNYGYQDPFGPHTGAMTRLRLRAGRHHEHVNGCGLVWTNHTESAPSVGTKALHDNLARTARSGLPHLARTSHAPMARRRRHRAYLLRRSAAISHGRVRQLLPVIAATRSAPVRARRAPDMQPELGKTRTCASTNAGLASRTGRVPQFATSAHQVLADSWLTLRSKQ